MQEYNILYFHDNYEMLQVSNNLIPEFAYSFCQTYQKYCCNG